MYAKEAQTTVAGREVKMLAFYGSHEDLEGAPTEGTVILRTKLPNKNQRVDCPCLATSLVNDPTLRQNSEYRKFTYDHCASTGMDQSPTGGPDWL